MSSGSPHEQHYRRIFDLLEAKPEVSQRSLAAELGIALGLTNLLVRRLVRKGWVRVTQIKPHRVRYFITPAGIKEKARVSRAYFDSSLEFYRHTRSRIRQRFAELAVAAAARPTPVRRPRLVFYGAGEAAEIAFVCLLETNLELVGVVDPRGARTKPFFGHPVHRPSAIQGLSVAEEPFDWLVVVSFGDIAKLQAEIGAMDLPAGRVFWL